MCKYCGKKLMLTNEVDSCLECQQKKIISYDLGDNKVSEYIIILKDKATSNLKQALRSE